MLYDSYTSAGLMTENGTGYRFIPYYVLPSCYTFIAKTGDTVIATTTLIVKSREDLPLEKIFSLSPIQQWNRRIAEGGTLAIHPDHRSRNGELVHALLKYTFQLAREDLGLHDIVMASNPTHRAFYEGLLLFRRLSEEVIDTFDYVNGAPAVGGHLNLTEMRKDYAATYQGVPEQRNLFKYYMEYEFDSFQRPDKVVSTYNGNRWSPTNLDLFLHGPMQGASALTRSELELLRRRYPSRDYDWIFNRYSLPEPSALVDANAAGFVRLKSQNTTPVVVRRIEEDRIHVTCERPYELLEGRELELLHNSKFQPPTTLQSVTLTGGSEATLRYDAASSPAITALLTNAGKALQPRQAALSEVRNYHDNELAFVG
ncbi:hypothetical protein GCM10007094_33970 [Pseudovibrio japonicus]|uniref:N-acyl amino acid synthase FeeM catalytic core domain-containing protein n=1 Tax=Pseudovibrio japonicus TaxID=366534 RepID=A0ABQ3EJ85_9HYPH|nr:hypothetical protein GCM10007094_33970 [Pseudovibrio japonicus]